MPSPTTALGEKSAIKVLLRKSQDFAFKNFIYEALA